MTAGLAWRAAADVLDSTGKFIVALQNDFRKLFCNAKFYGPWGNLPGKQE
ncbi:hypothetical protein ACFSHR_01590 [Azotobacter chroococcum]